MEDSACLLSRSSSDLVYFEGTDLLDNLSWIPGLGLGNCATSSDVAWNKHLEGGLLQG